MAWAMRRSQSVHTWWPRPREPVWTRTATWPAKRPSARAASGAKTASTTWTPTEGVPPRGGAAVAAAGAAAAQALGGEQLLDGQDARGPAHARALADRDLPQVGAEPARIDV